MINGEQYNELESLQADHDDGQCEGPSECPFCKAEAKQRQQQRARDAERWALRILDKIDHRL